MPTNDSEKKIILVVGGAGYIGSHMANMLAQEDYQVLILDNFSTGHEKAVQEFECIDGDIHDAVLLKKILNKKNIFAVMHFASFIQVGESVKDPAKYYINNVSGTLNLLNEMKNANVNYFIFSSTAAVYGDPKYTPIDEFHSIQPINPYGKSKHMIEEVLPDFASSYHLKYFILRYFNASGADPKNKFLGECHTPETHLIPLVLKVAKGEFEHLAINGNDYDTADGTCIRDYVHVSDICQAHLLALKYLVSGGKNETANLGTGVGHSILDVVKVAEEVTGKEILIQYGARRSGDPAVLVADPSYAKNILNWQPEYCALKTIVEHAWEFEKAH